MLLARGHRVCSSWDPGLNPEPMFRGNLTLVHIEAPLLGSRERPPYSRGLAPRYLPCWSRWPPGVEQQKAQRWPQHVGRAPNTIFPALPGRGPAGGAPRWCWGTAKPLLSSPNQDSAHPPPQGSIFLTGPVSHWPRLESNDELINIAGRGVRARDPLPPGWGVGIIGGWASRGRHGPEHLLLAGQGVWVGPEYGQGSVLNLPSWLQQTSPLWVSVSLSQTEDLGEGGVLLKCGRATWVTESVKHQTSGFCSGRDLRVVRWSPPLGLTFSREWASLPLPLPLSLPAPARALSLSNK